MLYISSVDVQDRHLLLSINNPGAPPITKNIWIRVENGPYKRYPVLAGTADQVTSSVRFFLFRGISWVIEARGCVGCILLNALSILEMITKVYGQDAAERRNSIYLFKDRVFDGINGMGKEFEPFRKSVVSGQRRLKFSSLQLKLTAR